MGRINFLLPDPDSVGKQRGLNNLADKQGLFPLLSENVPY